MRLVPAAFASPVVPGGDVGFARVAGGRLARVGVADGDHVLLARRATAFDGAIASVVDRTGRGSLWRVRHDRDALALFDGGDQPAGRTGPWPDVAGVVVGVLRRAAPSSPRRLPRGRLEDRV